MPQETQVKDEQTSTTQQPDEGQTTPADELNPEGQKAAELLSMLRENPDLVATNPDYKEFMEQADKMTEEGGKKEGEPTDKDKDTTDKYKDKDKTTVDDKDKEPPSTFFAEQKETPKTGFESFDDFKLFVKEKTDIDIEDKEQQTKFAEKLDEWKQSTEKLDETTSKLEGFNKIFEKLPSPLYNSLNNYINGKDWTEALQQNPISVDFRRGFDEQDAYEVTKAYMPDAMSDVSKEDFKENLQEDDKTTKQLLAASKKLFEQEKKEFYGRIESKEKEYIQTVEKIKTSADKSMSNLQKSFPGLSKKAVKEVESMMTKSDPASIFYNEDGSYSDDAAKRIALALFGEEEINRVKNNAKKAGKNEGRKEVVKNQNNKPERRSGEQAEHTPDSVKSILGTVKSDPYGGSNVSKS